MAAIVLTEIPTLPVNPTPEDRTRFIQLLRARYARRIVAKDLFGGEGENDWTNLVALIAEDRMQAEERQLISWLAKVPRTPDAEMPENILTAVLTERGDAGFLVGVAVGMQLGSAGRRGGRR